MTSGESAWAAAWEALRSGRPGEAERLGRAALADRPDSAEWWFLLGVACQSQGRPAQAAGGYARALARRPDLAEAHNNLGNALRDLNRSDEAVECFRRALA